MPAAGHAQSQAVFHASSRILTEALINVNGMLRTLLLQLGGLVARFELGHEPR